MRAATLLASLVATAALSGCASIFSEQTYPVQVTSSPSRASIEITDEDGNVVYNGTTPATIKLASSAGYFDGQRYTVKFSKDGYDSQVFVIDSSVDGWYWGNILLGGVLGMLIIDPATGAMFDLPKSASASLSPLPVEPIAANTPAGQTAMRAISREQQLQQLMQQNLPYEEYQARYREITGE